MSVIKLTYNTHIWEYDTETDTMYQYSGDVRVEDELFVDDGSIYFHKSSKDNVIIFATEDDDLASMNYQKFMRCIRNRLKSLGIIIKIKKTVFEVDDGEIHAAYEMIFANDADYAYFLLHFHNFCV
jgi:hypothetical protein